MSQGWALTSIEGQGLDKELIFNELSKSLILKAGGIEVKIPFLNGLSIQIDIEGFEEKISFNCSAKQIINGLHDYYKNTPWEQLYKG